MRQNIHRLLITVLALAVGSALPAVCRQSEWHAAPRRGSAGPSVSYYYDPSPDTVFESDAVYDGLVSYDVKTGSVRAAAGEGVAAHRSPDLGIRSA